MSGVLRRLARGTRYGGLLAGVSIACAMASTGCAHLDTELYKELPTYRVDRFASEVTWQRQDGEAVSSDKASVARVEIAEMLDELVEDRKDRVQARPARFRARIVQLGSVGSRSYDMTLGFQVGDQFFATQVEAPSIEDGIHWAMYKGIHPEKKGVPEFYYPDAATRARYAKIGGGISSILVGGVFVFPSMNIAWMAEHSAIGTSFLIANALMVGGGIALLIWGVKSTPSNRDKPVPAKSTSVLFRPTPSGFRIDF